MSQKHVGKRAGLALCFAVAVGGCGSSKGAQSGGGGGGGGGGGKMADTCAEIFDRIRPSLEGQWEATLPLDLFQKLRGNVADLKVAFVKDCPGMSQADLACAQGDNSAAMAACDHEPDDKKERCMYDAERERNNPLHCKGVQELMDRTGAKWMADHGLDK